MKNARPIVLSIAGFDPSAGAGVLADIKTFEANKVYGMGVITANTFQDESEFDSVDWVSSEDTIKQCEVLIRKHKIANAKIGLIKDLDEMTSLVSYLISHVSHLIWDPILKASAGYEFHTKMEKQKLSSILDKIFLLTPNTEEVIALSGIKDPVEGAKKLAEHCHVLLKGGHDNNNKGKDLLFTKEGKQFSFNPKKKNVSPKHGSGCVLSAAITANLANGYKIHSACLRAKQYTETVLASNKTLLGYHKI
jgi:hydroxymethylpyrimidine/phosphomethylpyrimidine kinase